MTKKKFIKTLRSYRLHRDKINEIVNDIVDKRGELSYNRAIEIINNHMFIEMMKDIPMTPINYDLQPVEYLDYEMSVDYMINRSFILGVDLAKEPGKVAKAMVKA